MEYPVIFLDIVSNVLKLNIYIFNFFFFFMYSAPTSSNQYNLDILVIYKNLALISHRAMNELSNDI